jgi:hypothetical protein
MYLVRDLSNWIKIITFKSLKLNYRNQWTTNHFVFMFKFKKVREQCQSEYGNNKRQILDLTMPLTYLRDFESMLGIAATLDTSKTR